MLCLPDHYLIGDAVMCVCVKLTGDAVVCVMQTQDPANLEHTHQPIEGRANCRGGGRGRGGGHGGANNHPSGRSGGNGVSLQTEKATAGPQQSSTPQGRQHGGRRGGRGRGRGRGGPSCPTQPSPGDLVPLPPQEGQMAVLPGPAAITAPGSTPAGETVCLCKLVQAGGCLMLPYLARAADQ